MNAEQRAEKYKNISNNVIEELKVLREKYMLDVFDLREGDRIHINYTRVGIEGGDREVGGYVQRETKHHILVLVHDSKRKSAYRYCIKKILVNSAKFFDDTDNPNMKSYKNLKDMWEKARILENERNN